MAGSFDRPNPLARALRGGAVSDLLGPRTAIKRRAYFAFHFDDVMRVNNVRKAFGREFCDSSLWESRQLEGDEALKRLIRGGVEYTSVVCVLIGSYTYRRRWVRYEIARAVIDGRGLLGVHINGIPHHRDYSRHQRGFNPLAYMGVGKVQENALALPRYYLYELAPQGWERYADHTAPVTRPPYLPDPSSGYVMPLVNGTIERDYVEHAGSLLLGTWIDAAAQAAGR